MSYLTSDDARYRINFNEGFYEPSVDPGGVIAVWHPPFNDSRDWVEIIDELSEYDRQALRSAAQQYGGETRIRGQQVQFFHPSYQDQMIAYFTRVIKDWSLTENGRPLPRNEETYRRLGAVAKWLGEAIDAHYTLQIMTDEQLGNFEAARSSHTLTGGHSPETSATSSSPDGSEGLTPIESHSYESARSA